MRKTITGLALLALAYTGTTTANTLQGKVVRIADGDTITLLMAGNKQERIRLAEIDAPESGQAFGNRSKQSLIQMCGAAVATVAVQDRDRYGRVIGRVSCNGVDTTREQIVRGMAWVYREYSKDNSLLALEQKARQGKQGLWADPAPVAPWDWRKGKRTAVVAVASGNPPKAAAGPIRGNRNSKVYHLPGCPSYSAMNPKNITPFQSEQQAKQAGYRKAGNC